MSILTWPNSPNRIFFACAISFGTYCCHAMCPPGTTAKVTSLAFFVAKKKKVKKKKQTANIAKLDQPMWKDP